MRLSIAFLAAAAALSAAGAATAASVEIRDAVANVTVVPEDRSDVKVEFLTTNKDLPLVVRMEGRATVIDGGLDDRRFRGCSEKHDSYAARVRGVGNIAHDDVPKVVVRTPRDVEVRSGGVVFGVIGRAASLDLRNGGCSHWTIADVAGDVNIVESGAGTVKMGASGKLNVRLSGAGDIHATKIRDGFEAHLSGVGKVSVDDMAGPMAARVSGLGQIRVADGHAGAVHASVSGMGSVDFGGAAQSLQASISGLGNIRVKAVSGPVSKSVSGGGHVTVGELPS